MSTSLEDQQHLLRARKSSTFSIHGVTLLFQFTVVPGGNSLSVMARRISWAGFSR
jgi:hypothetical protein